MNAADFSLLRTGRGPAISLAATLIFLIQETTSTATAQELTLLPTPNANRQFRLEMPNDTIKGLNNSEKTELGERPFAHTDFFIDPKSGQVEAVAGDQVFSPLELMFTRNIEERCLSIEIVNRSSDNLLIDLEAVNAIQLVYWFQVDGTAKGSGYTGGMQVPIPREQINHLHEIPSGRFVSLAPGKSIGKINKSLDDLLAEIRPYAGKIDDFVGIQVFATGLSVAVVKDGRATFNDQLYGALTSGKPQMLSKQDINHLLVSDQ